MTRKQKATVPTGSRQAAIAHSQTSSTSRPNSGERASAQLAWLVALLVARWLIPTEAAAEGMTLWIVQLVLLTAVGRLVWLWRTGQSLPRCDRIDGAIGLLVGGQVVSALAVVFTIGNQRGAINLAWEWIGSGVLIWLFRQELKSARIVREVCFGLTLTGAVLAGYGMYQHYVWYPQMVREYDRMIGEVNELTIAKDGTEVRTRSASDERRLARLQSEMSRQGIPLEASARMMWNDRLKGSSEPIGLFALANSFAGLLVVLALIALGNVSRRAGRFVWVFVGVMGFCLILSKCRTAMCGLIAGACWWGGHRLIEHIGTGKSARLTSVLLNRFFIRSVLVGAAIIGVGFAAATLSGGLDIKVLTESSKSLRYRLEYWQGTWATIREHLWWGTGPANFRDYYLAHKLPESSEEIADPHNMILDVWANAGLLGLSGLLACVMLMVRSWTRRLSDRDDARKRGDVDEPVESADRLWTSAAVWGAGLAFPLAAIGMEFLGHGIDDRLWWLGGIWWLIWLGLLIWERRILEPDSFGQQHPAAIAQGLEAANIALLVHLLGAGGIAMPAITQLLLLIWVLRSALSVAVYEIGVKSADGELGVKTSSSKSAVDGVKSEPVWFGMIGTAAVLSGLCLVSGTLPELTCRTALELGDAAWMEHRNLEAAFANYANAVAADRFSLEPLERIADLSFQRASQSQQAADFEEAAQRQKTLIARLPFSPHPYRRLGQLWLARFEKTQDRVDAKRAAAAFDAAVKRYPHHAALLSEWATALNGAGQATAAQEAARRALAQDDVNRRAEHTDKYLDAVTRSRLERR